MNLIQWSSQAARWKQALSPRHVAFTSTSNAVAKKPEFLEVSCGMKGWNGAGVLPPYYFTSGQKGWANQRLEPQESKYIYWESRITVLHVLRRSYFKIFENGIGTLNPILGIGLDS